MQELRCKVICPQDPYADDYNAEFQNHMRDQDLADLRQIQSADPDGGSVEPTDEDHARHKAWAIERFGERLWVRYATTNWEGLNW